jgi:protein ImuB
MPPAAPHHRRRILSLWFPRLAADRVLRLEPGLAETPLAVVCEIGNLRQIAALNTPAATRGLRRGQPLSEAVALCPDLVTRIADPSGEAAFLTALRRWAGKFSPWVAEAPPESLLIDLTGCAHLFGGRDRALRTAGSRLRRSRPDVRAGIADTAGAAWALARFSGTGATGSGRNGDAIDQEARATRSRAGKRHWTRGGAAPPTPPAPDTPRQRIALPGSTRQALAPLPVAALRIAPETAEGLARLGLRRIGDVLGMPRAGLARRFGADLVRRLDQALGVEPEPITPAAAPSISPCGSACRSRSGWRMTSSPVSTASPPCSATSSARRDAAPGACGWNCRASMATPRCWRSASPGPPTAPISSAPSSRSRPASIDAGFGIDRLRLSAPLTEPLHATSHKGGWAVSAEATAPRGEDQAMADLIARIGARVGLEAITRARPADSHIPEKTATPLAAAWSERATDWPRSPRARPLTLFRPEPIRGPTTPPTFPPASPGAAARSTPAPPSAPNASRPNGGSTIPTGAPACATTGA